MHLKTLHLIILWKQRGSKNNPVLVYLFLLKNGNQQYKASTRKRAQQKDFLFSKSFSTPTKAPAPA